MKIGAKALLAGATFPPLLALLVGLTILWRSSQENELSRRLIALEKITDEVLVLNAATYECLDSLDEQTILRWRARYQALVRNGIARLDPEVVAEDRAVFGSIKANCGSIEAAFDQLASFAPLSSSARPEELSKRRASKAALVQDLASRYQAILSGVLQLAQASHADSVAAQQRADSIVIILSAIVALFMGALLYTADKGELAQRERTSEALRKSDIQLSDAFLKLRRASEQAVQLERLHAVEQTSRALVTEWKRTVSPLLPKMRPLLAGDHEPKEAAVMIGSVEQAAEKINKDVENLSLFLQQSVGPGRTPVDLNQVVEEALKATVEKRRQPSWAGIDTATDLRDIRHVFGNPSDLRDAVIHLIANAVEAMPKGGTLSLRTEQIGGWVGLEIHDTGIGMTDEMRRRCVEPFFSTKGSGSAGMGLTIVNAVVRQHHGTIDIESAPGQGTTVAICLPVEARAPSAPDETRCEYAKPSRKLTVLVVDDESWSRVGIVHYLTTEGHAVQTADNGRDGLAKFQEAHFDVVITDRAMPDMNGEELAAAIKKIDARRPVILITGCADGVVQGGKSPKCVDAVMGKPVKQAELFRVLAGFAGGESSGKTGS